VVGVGDPCDGESKCRDGVRLGCGVCGSTLGVVIVNGVRVS